jgi:hypothetical protein
MPFGTLASRAAVWNRILPSRSCGGSGSGFEIDGTIATTRGAQPLQSSRDWHALPFGQKKPSAFSTVTLRERKFATKIRVPSGEIAMPCGTVPTESGTARIAPVVTSYSLP